MNEITTTPAGTQSTAMTLAEPVLADSLLNFVARAMTDPSIDVTKMEALIRIQREIVADEARLAFNEAMNAAQAEMMPVTRDANNDQTKSKYARLETIDAAIRPIYTRHGFHISFNSEPIEGPNDRIVCEVTRGRHTKRFQLEAAPDTMGPQGKANKTPLHGLASTVSYLRRYLVCMAFNVVLANEDNDGNRTRGETGALLSRAQVEELNELMRATRTLEPRFLAAMCPHHRSIEAVPASDFPRLKNALLTKKSALAKLWRTAVQQEDAAKKGAAA